MPVWNYKTCSGHHLRWEHQNLITQIYLRFNLASTTDLAQRSLTLCMNIPIQPKDAPCAACHAHGLKLVITLPD